MELLAAACICLGDWMCACSHMAYEYYGWKEFYRQPSLIWQDRWHLFAAGRYLPMVLLAWLAFEYQWGWYLGTAAVNFAGWQICKRIHGKPWPWHHVFTRIWR